MSECLYNHEDFPIEVNDFKLKLSIAVFFFQQIEAATVFGGIGTRHLYPFNFT
jgi:hypothetical protein